MKDWTPTEWTVFFGALTKAIVAIGGVITHIVLTIKQGPKRDLTNSEMLQQTKIMKGDPVARLKASPMEVAEAKAPTKVDPGE